MSAPSFLLLDPEELVFRDVKLSQAYAQTVFVTNTLRGPLEVTIKPGSSDRYTVVPPTLRLRAEETASVEVRLRVLRFAQRQKAVEQGHRDVFHVKGSHFDQKFYATFWLAPEPDVPGRPRAQVSGLGPPQAAPVMGRGPIRAAGAATSPRALTKSVSFADTTTSPSASRRGASAFAGAAGRYEGNIVESSASTSPPHIRGGLRHALSGLRSPQRAASLNALNAGSQDMQLDAFDRASVSGPASFPGSASFGSGRAHGLSASIDTSQLADRYPVGQSFSALGGRAGHASELGGTGLGGLSRPPRPPPRSLPASPDRLQAPAQLARVQQGGARAQSAATPSGLSLGPQLQTTASTSDVGAAGSAAGYTAQPASGSPSSRQRRTEEPQGPGVQPLPAQTFDFWGKSPERGGSPVKGGFGRRYDRSSSDPSTTDRPEWEGRPQDGTGGRQQLAERQYVQDRQFEEEEARAGRADGWSVEEEGRMEEHPRSPSRPQLRSPYRRQQSRPDVGGQGRYRSGSQSPEALLQPPSSRLSQLLEEMADPKAPGNAASDTSKDGSSRPLDAHGSKAGLQQQPVPPELRADVLDLHREVRGLERQQASMRRTIEQQQEVMRDKDLLLRRLEGQLKSVKAEQAAAASAKPDFAAEQSAAERAALLSERTSLSVRLAAVEASLASSREEAAALRRLQLELQSRHPKVTRALEAAVGREQAMQEERNRKALELLMGKDGRIKELEAQVDVLQQSGEQLKTRAADLQERLQEAEAQVVNALREKEALVDSARYDRQQAQLLIADLESRITAGSALGLEAAAARERAAAAEQRATEADRRAAAAVMRAAAAESDADRRAVAAAARASAAESMLYGVEREQRQDAQQRDEQLESALAAAEELRSGTAALQQRHAEASRLQEVAHRKQVAKLEAKISGLSAELARSRTSAASSSSSSAIPAARGPPRGAPSSDASGPSPQESAGSVGASRQASYAAPDVSLDSGATQVAPAPSKERLADMAELGRLRDSLAERDAQVTDLLQQLVEASAQSKSEGANAPASLAAPLSRAASANSSPPRSTSRAHEATSMGFAAPLAHEQHGRTSGSAAAGDSHAASARGQAVASGDEVDALRRQLARSEASLRAAQERLALLEARSAVAQEASGKGEAQLEAMHRSVAGSVHEHERLRQELGAASAGNARLNARISDLVLAEQVARAEVDAARSRLGQLQELHSAQTLAMQQRLQILTEHLSATQPEVLPMLLRADGRHLGASVQPAASMHPGSVQPDGGAVLLSREAELEKALEAAETAVAVMQGRLLVALRTASNAGDEAARVRQEAQWERDRLESEVRLAKEEGSLRIRGLEESVSRFGARGGEAAQALARSASAADAAVRRESRLRSELALAQQAAQRANTQAAELRLRLRDCEHALREAQLYGGLLPFLHDNAPATSAEQGLVGARASPAGQGSSGEGAAGSYGAVSYHVLDAQLEVKLRQQAAELSRKQQVIARLVEVAEKAQAEAAACQGELDVLRKTLPDPKQPLQQQYSELQRLLGSTEAELRACRDARASCELSVSRLQQQLVDKGNELDSATGRLSACERDVASYEEAAARKALEVRGAVAREATMLSRRASEAQRNADEAETRAREAAAQATSLRAELAESRAKLEAMAAELRRSDNKAREDKRAAAEALRHATRAADRASSDAEERRSQLSVVMETIEVLQAGNSGEREQRIMSLTVQLSAAASRECMAEQRAQELLADAEAQGSRAQRLQSEVAELGQLVARLEQQLAAASSQHALLEDQVATGRAELRARDAAAVRTARELDDWAQRVNTLEGQVEALRRTLSNSQARHVTQLSREREEASAAVRQARAESSSMAAVASQDARLERFQASVEELMAWVEDRTQKQRAAPGAAAASADTTEQPGPDKDGAADLHPTQSWMLTALQRFKELALESEREYLAAATDARSSRMDGRWAWSRVQRLQTALEQRTNEWHVAEDRVQHLERAVARRSEEAAVHALEHVALQDKQVSELAAQLQATTAKLVAATAQGTSAEASLAAARATIAALQRQAMAVTAEHKELLARMAASEVEAAGSPEALHLGADAALAQRDLTIRQYWDAQVATLLAKPDSRDRVMALAREVCALKLSESQLQAALAAAKHRGDASAQLAASMTTALRAAEERLEQLQDVVPTEGTPSGTALAAAGTGPAGSLGLEAARLSAQLVAQSHEVFRLQGAALRSKQAFERRESDLEELQAQVAAAELLSSQIREEGSAALMALREQLTESHEQDRQLLIREIQQIQARLVSARELANKEAELAEQRAADAATAADLKVDARLSEALAGQVRVSQLHEAETRALCAEREHARLTAQSAALQEALTQAQAQIAEMQDVREVTGAAVASLEATLARVEKVAASSSGGAGSSRLPLAAGARRVPVAGAQSGSASSGAGPAGSDGQGGEPHQLQGLAGLSRELVRTKLAEAEAVRKMRAAARSELELRQRLLQRDERISELKEQLAAKARAADEVRRRASAPDFGPARATLAASGGPGGPGVGKASLRSRSPSPVRGGAPAAARPKAVPGSTFGAGQDASEAASQDPRLAAEALDAEHVAAQLASMRLELARKQAEIEHLQGAVAQANAAAPVHLNPARPPSGTAAFKAAGAANAAVLNRLKDQLASANAEIASAFSSASSLIRRLNHQLADSRTLPGGSTIGRGAGSPARRLPAAAGPMPSDGLLAPGALSSAMQQLASVVREAQLGGAAGAAPPAAPRSAPVQPQPGSWALPHSPTRGSPPLRASDEELRALKAERGALLHQRDELGALCSGLARELEQCRTLLLEQRQRAEAQEAAQEAQVLLAEGAGAPGGSVASTLAPSISFGGLADTAASPAPEGVSARRRIAPPPDFSSLRAAAAAAATAASRVGAQPPATTSPHGATVASPPRHDEPPGSIYTPASASTWETVTPGTAVAMPARDAASTAMAPGLLQQDLFGPNASAGTGRPAAVPDRSALLGTEAPSASSAAALAVAQVQAASLLTAASRQKARADKWKQRSKELGAQLSRLNASAAAREAAVSERCVASAHEVEAELRRCKAEMSRLQAALSGAEAVRRELEAGHNSTGSEARATGARAAEAAARAATLQCQLETERAQAAAAMASHHEEVAVLKAAVAQEKGERAQLLASLRESQSSARQAGDVDARVQSELLEAHAAAAAARAAAERSQERATTWREEAESLRRRLQQLERGRAQLMSTFESRLAAAELRTTESSAAAAAQVEELAGKMAAAQAEAAALPSVLEAKLRGLESELSSLQARLDAAQRSAHSRVQAGRWNILAHVVRYQAALKQAQADLATRQAAWERERATLQVSASEAVRRGEDLTAEVARLRTQALEVQAAADAERQQLAARHVAHIQETQARIERERHAMVQEAGARAAAAAAASECAADAASAARLTALESDYGRRLAQMEAGRQELMRELQLVQAQFTEYQAQKLAETTSLEQRLHAYIQGAGPHAAPGRGGGARQAELDGGGNDCGASVASSGYRACRAKGLRQQRACSGAKGLRRRSGGGAKPAVVIIPSALAPPPGTGAQAGGGAPMYDHAQGGLQLAPSQQVALARGSEALAAALREVAFERSLRARGEAQVELFRSTLARLRAKLRVVSEQLEDARADAVSQDEHRQLQSELSVCREQLKACRTESARRQKALLAFQGIAAYHPDGMGPAVSLAGPATGRGQHNLAQDRDDADPLAAALEAAAAGARASANALEAERAARQGAEAKLREAKVAAERKGALLKEMKRRVEDLEAVAQQHASALGADAAAESRARALAAAVVRKDAVIKELRDRLEAAQAVAVAGSAAAEAGGEELEVARRAGARLRADLAKRDASMKVVMADLDKERRMLTAATKQLCELSKREASTRRQAASAVASLRSRAGEVLEAVRALCRVLLQAVAAMDGAAARLLLAPGAPAAPGAAPAAGGGCGSAGRAAGGGGGPMTADAISLLTSLSVEDVQHLLGSETRALYGGGGGDLYGSDDAMDQLPYDGPALGAAGGGAAALEAARVVGDLLSVVEVALAAGAAGPGAFPQEADQGAEEADGSLLRDQLLAAVAASSDPAATAAGVLGFDTWAGRLLDMAGPPEPERTPAARRGGPGSGGAEGHAAGGDPWDRRALGVLVERVHAEARRAEGALAAALRRGGRL